MPSQLDGDLRLFVIRNLTDTRGNVRGQPSPQLFFFHFPAAGAGGEDGVRGERVDSQIDK